MKLLDQSAVELRKKLDGYLVADPTYRAVFDYTKERFEVAKNLAAHNWEHAYRDTINAIFIGEAEGADMAIVLPAITMHDIGFLYGATGKTHGAIGADKLAEYLQDGGINYPEEAIQKMANCIRTHKGSMHNEKPESLEAKVVADADLLEKFGLFGVYQTIRTYTEFDWLLASDEAQEMVRQAGFNGISYTEPILGVVTRTEDGETKKALVYEYIENKGHLNYTVLQSEHGIDEDKRRWLVNQLHDYFRQHDVFPGDLGMRHILFDSELNLHLIDAEAYIPNADLPFGPSDD